MTTTFFDCLAALPAARQLKKMRRAAGEAVRRGVEFDDWMVECVPRLIDMGEDKLTATTMCSNMWREACEEEGIKP